MMKKQLLGLSLIFSLFLLTACQSNPQPKSDGEKAGTAKLIIKFEDRTDSQEITFEKEDSVMDILKEHHDVEEESGMVTSIDGVSQDPDSKTYWMYSINDEMAPKGAGQMTISDGDSVVFYLEKMD